MLQNQSLRGLELLNGIAAPSLWAAAGLIARSAPRWHTSACRNQAQERKCSEPPDPAARRRLSAKSNKFGWADATSLFGRTFHGAAALLKDPASEAIVSEALNFDLSGDPDRAEQLLSGGITVAEAARRAGQGPTDADLAELYGQLARFLKKHGRENHALAPALQALNLVRGATGRKDSVDAALAGLRYGLILLACGQVQESVGHLCNSLHVLEGVLAAVEGPGKIQGEEGAVGAVALRPALAEAVFYKGLAELAASQMDEASVAAHEPELAKGVALMREHHAGSLIHPGEDATEAEWAMYRSLQNCFPDEVLQMLAEYRRLLASVYAAGEFEKAARLHKQAIRLILSYDPERENQGVVLRACSEAVGCSKLLFTLGRYEEAVEVLESCLNPALDQAGGAAVRLGDWRLLLSKMRLGIVFGAQGLLGPAEVLLQEVRPDVVDLLAALGDRDNPAVHEVDLMLALIKYQRTAEEGKGPSSHARGSCQRLAQRMQELLAVLEKESAPSMAPLIGRYRSLVAATVGSQL